MLWDYVLKYGSDWEKSLPHVEFSYNNSYQASLKMLPFEALYGRKCRTPLMWSEVGQRSFFGPTKINDAKEGVSQVQENLRIAQSQQKSYIDKRQRDLELDVGDYVYLHLPTSRHHQVPSEREVGTKVCRTLPDLSESWQASLWVELPKELTRVHPMFHVFQLRKRLKLLDEQVPIEELDI